MANKKIGAYIALDGEKQFRQDVTNCNKTITTLKSEMSLVKAESEGQANSLESLRKKHEVLLRTLETHKQKESALQTGLDHARESYDKVGKKLEDYKAKLQSAREELENMQKNSDTTEKDLEEQKKTVAELSDIVEKGEQTYKKAGNRIEEWKTKLNTAQAQTIKATRALNENAAYMREAEMATDHCATSIDEFGKKVKEVSEVTWDLGTALMTNLTDRALSLAGSGLQEFTQFVSETETSMKQLQASTGLTTQKLGEYKESMDSLYKNNYGESLEDIANSMALVKQYTNETDPSAIEKLTENGIVLRDVFDIELSESIRGADALMDNFGVDAEEAFNLMAAGAQNGLNKSGELADNIAEYGALWGQAGFSAKEMFSILDNGLDSGAYSLDKVNDFVKEFGNSLADGRIEDSLGSFSSKTQDLFDQWKAGKVTTKDVFYSVIKDISSATNKQEMLTLASNTWSSLGEDNALKVIESLANVNDAYDNVCGTMEDIKSVKYDTLESRITQLGRKVKSDFIQPIAEKALPKIEEGLDAVIENTDTLIPLTEVAIATLLTYKTASAAISAYKTVTEAAAKSQGILNAVMSANPATMIALGVAAVGTAWVVYSDNARKASEETGALREEAKKLNEEMLESQENLRGSLETTRETVETTTAGVEAMKPVAEELAALAKQESYTNEEHDRMVTLVTQLKTIYPEMGIEIDDVTGKLSMGSEEIMNYISSLELMAETEAYKQGMQESIDDATKAIKERTLAENELNGLLEEQHDIERDINTISTELAKRSYLANKSQSELNQELADGIITQEDYNRAITGVINEYIDYNGVQRDAYDVLAELNNERLENKRTIEDLSETIEGHNEIIEDAQEQSEIYSEKYNELTAQVEAATAAEQANADTVSETAQSNITVAGEELAAFTSLSEGQQQLAVDVTNSVLTMQGNVQSALESQMNMFEEFSAGSEVTTEEILANMQSQVDGVTAWEENMNTLMTETKSLADGTVVSIDEGLMQYLVSLGPEGSAYMQEFVNMSGEELAKANELWEKSVDIKGLENELGQQLTQSIGELSAGSAEAWDQLAQDLGMEASESGVYVVQGMVEGMKRAADQLETAGEEAGDSLLKSIDTSLGISSPSKKAKRSGEYTGQGLVNGINGEKTNVRSAGLSIGKAAISGLEKADMYNHAVSAGKNFGSGIATGIQLTTQQIAAQAAATVRTAINAANAEQRANSPAKETINVGHNFGEGIEIGIRDLIPDVSEASADIMNAAISTVEVNSMIRESIVLPRNAVRVNGVASQIENSSLGINYKEMSNIFKDAIEEIVIKVLKNAQINLGVNGREVDRFLKNRGVVYG